jgi:hypothetical protein
LEKKKGHFEQRKLSSRGENGHFGENCVYDIEKLFQDTPYLVPEIKPQLRQGGGFWDQRWASQHRP